MRVLLTIAVSGLLVACNHGGTTANSNSLNSVPNAGKNLKSGFTWIAVRPGLGFNSKTDTFADRACYKPSTNSRGDVVGVVYGGAEGTATFSAGLRTSDIITARSNTLKSEFKNKTYYTDNELNYLYNSQETSLDMYYYFYAHHTRSVDVKYSTGLAILSDDGLKVYNENKNNPLEFKRLCGDTLVNQYREGASVIIRAKLNFNSYMEKNEFNARLKAGFSNKAPAPVPWNPLAMEEISSGSFDNTLKLAATETGIDVKINIDALQMGGDPSQLPMGIGNTTVNCTATNVYGCDSILNGVQQYASMFASQFISQRDDSGYENAKMNFDGYMILGENIDSQLKFDSSASTTPNMRNNRDYLGNKYDEIAYYKNKVTTLASLYPVPLSFDSITELSTAIEKLKETENRLRNLSDTQDCWHDGAEEEIKCNSVVEKIKSDPDLNIDLPTSSNPSLVSQIETLNELLTPIFYAENMNATFYPTNKALNGDKVIGLAVPTMAKLFMGENPAHVEDVSSYIKEDSAKHIDGVIKGLYKDGSGNNGTYSLLLYLHQSPQRALLRTFINGHVAKNWTELHTIKNPFYIDTYKVESQA